METHHQLLGFSGVDLEAASLAPVHKFLNQISVFSAIIGLITDDDGRVVRELLQVTAG